MAGSSLLALIDDITSVLDDVAVLTKTAAMKTTGVMGDDLALNAEQVSGVHVDRELPVVWAVAKGSFVNKLILVPAALAISAFFPPAIMPLMMIGGLFLCYEGFEKVAHKVLHRDGEEAAHHQAHLKALTDPTADVIAIEKDKIKGAIRTDFVLSAEIVVITLGTMSHEPMLQQVLALSAVAIAATVFVYGLVGGIVKLDDLGVALQARAGAGARRIGGWILRAAPVMMKTLSFLGTAAMFTVGGSIIVHGVPAVEHLIHGVVEPVAARSGFLGTIMTTLLDALVGLIAGGLAVALMAGVQRVRRGRSALGVALIGATTALAACQPASSRPEPVSPTRADDVSSDTAAAVRQSLASATQLVIVTTGGWDSTTGELRRFTRTSVDARWRPEGSAEPVVVGRTGLAWGVGFDRPGPRKVEGDGRAPAGVFPLETAFGFAPADSMRWLHLPYMPLTPNTECVDDAASAHYNMVLERDAVQAVDWTSSERMRRIPQYRLGLIVGYNTSPRVKGRGSCIFFHIWEGPRSPTVGCTALDATALTTLTGWLDPRARPVVVQLPATVLQEVRDEWGLPALAAG